MQQGISSVQKEFPTSFLDRKGGKGDRVIHRSLEWLLTSFSSCLFLLSLFVVLDRVAESLCCNGEREGEQGTKKYSTWKRERGVRGESGV